MGSSLNIYMCVCKREIKSKSNSTKPKGTCPNTLNYVWFLEALIMKAKVIPPSLKEHVLIH